jgi:ribose transport system permease protein
MAESGMAAAHAARIRLAGLARTFDWRQYIIYIAFALVFIYFSVTLHSSGFLTTTNLLNILRATATISIMAVAMSFVIGAAQIDLSVGATAGLASVTTAMTIEHYGIFAGIAVGLATGILVGALNGALVAILAIPSFLVTLGMLGIAHGAAQWITNTEPQPILNDRYNNAFGSGDVGPFPSLVLWTLAVVVVGHVVLRKTSFGRQVLATGGNAVAARFSGVDTRRVTFFVLVLMGLAAALAGMLYAGRLQSGRFQWGEGDELSVIAAVILGGTSLFGGRSSVIGSLLGSVMIGLINNGLILKGLESSQQEIARGAIIVVAVALGRRK